MAKKPKTETTAVETPEAPEAPEFPTVDPPAVPPGNPLTWTLEQWLAASGTPVDKITEELTRLAAQAGAAGLPFQMLLNVWESNTSPAQREAGVRFILGGLMELAATGSGPSGHAGAELA